VEVIAVTANSGYDANTGEREEEDTAGHSDTFGSAKQSRVLAELEANGKLHLALVYRGTKENAKKFIDA
jgi:pilus assembly protein CpaB